MKMVHLKVVIRLIIVGAASLGIVACGGGGGGSAAPAAPAVPDVTVSGTVTYTSFKLSTAGIDYANPIEKPIRGAVVELQDASGKALASTNSSETGGYSLAAPANSSVRVVVKAALGTPASPDTKVVDNTSNGALYATSMDVATATSNVSQSFNAGSGWDGTAYTGPRTAGPFAILDFIRQGQQLILSADSTVVFTPLTVNWSTKNKPTEGKTADGDIGTSNYNPTEKALYILGAADIDTDEYDGHQIAHEWGHYFEANFSRSDSPGNTHAGGDILHPALAFGEAYGYALAGMILNDPLILDTSGVGQKDGSGERSLEADTDLDTAMHPSNKAFLDGYYSENSVSEVLYDIFDSGAADDDAVALGFTPIYKVLVNGQKNTKAFTTIFSFLHHLKREAPASAQAITALAARENIDTTSDDEFQNPTDTQLLFLYTTIDPAAGQITLDGEGNVLGTRDTFGKSTPPEPGNKLYNHRFFRSTVTTAGCYTLTVTPVAPTATADVAVTFAGNTTDLDANDATTGAVVETVSDTFTEGELSVFSVRAFSDNVAFSVLFSSAPSACTP
jgi:hypothetical protein